MSGADSYFYPVYYGISTFFTVNIAQLSLVITASVRYNQWLDRLILFPLGLPDNVVIPEREMLAQLKEEFSKNGFNEQLLEEYSDILSQAKTKNPLKYDADEDNYSYSHESTSLPAASGNNFAFGRLLR